MIGNFLLILLAGALPGIIYGAVFAEKLRPPFWRAVRSLRRVPVAQKHTGSHRAGAAPVVALPPAQVIEHADKMHEISERYVTQEEWQSYMNAGRAIEPVRVADEHPPWTGSQQKLTPEMEARMEAAELDRRIYLAEHLASAAQMTGDDATQAMRDAMDALRQPVHGEKCVADVLAAEDGARPVMMP